MALRQSINKDKIGITLINPDNLETEEVLNDLKQNLKNQNSLLPSKNYRLKQNDLNEL